MKNILKIAAILTFFQPYSLLQAQDFSLAIPDTSSNNQTTTLYCHGVCGDSTQVNDYKDMILGDCKALNFPDTQKPKGLSMNKIIHALCKKLLNKQHINREKMYLGQGEDIQTIKNQIDSGKSYILYGLCRGAAAIINYMAQYNPENITALVLDEAPANMLDIVDNIMFTDKNGEKILSTPLQREQWLRFCCPSYPRQAKSPVENIAAIKNKNVPIFLSYGIQGSTFHYPTSAWKLYIAFKKAGFKHVYLCELEHYGQNAQGEDKRIYSQALHSFYKKYNLAYTAHHATLTEAELQTLQPTVQEIQKKLRDSKK